MNTYYYKTVSTRDDLMTLGYVDKDYKFTKEEKGAICKLIISKNMKVFEENYEDLCETVRMMAVTEEILSELKL